MKPHNSKLKALIILVYFIIFSSNIIIGQNKITGLITDSLTNKPIEYVNIQIKNSNVGTTTDNKGTFVLNYKNNSKIELIFSHINYLTKTVVMEKDKLSDNMIFILSPKVQEISDIIVSATLSEKPLSKISKSAYVITKAQVANNFNSNIIDMLSKTPGFTQVWEYHSPILLRGMNSNRLLVMKNGDRRIGTFPGGYFGQDINIYDIKKIEVVKGPGSVIYGSGAISGIINIIGSEPYGVEKSNVQLISGYGGNNNEFLESGAISLIKENYGFNLNAKYRKTDDYYYANNERAVNSNFEDKDFSFNTGYKFSSQHQIAAYIDYHYGDWGKPRGFNGPEKYFTEIRNIEKGFHSALNYTYFPNTFIQSLNFNIYYDRGTRDYYQYKNSNITKKRTSLELVHYKDNYGGGRLFSTLSPTSNLIITTGIDGYAFFIDSPTDNYDYYNNTFGRIEGNNDAGQNNIGIFINNEWQMLPSTILEFGIRYDYASVYEGKNNYVNERTENRTAFSGNFGIVYSFNNFTTLSLNIGRAFRMPITEELFTKTVSCKGIKQGNPNLEPEFSWNFDLGLRGSNICNLIDYEIALFYNVLSNYINESPAINIEDVDFTYSNVNAVLTGGEVSFAYTIPKLLSNSDLIKLWFAGSYQYGIDMTDKNNHSPLFGVPPFLLNTSLQYNCKLLGSFISGYNTKLELEYAAAQNRVANVPDGTDGGPWGYETSESHLAANFSVGVDLRLFNKNQLLRLNVKNLFNSNFQPFGSYIPVMGRNIKLLLSFSI